MIEEQSVFARFALYSDHCHLSVSGNRLMAGALLTAIESTGLAVR